MAGKRSAGYDLNADNWDKEDEPEDRGVFKTASQDELKNRVIKKARRKMVGGTSADGDAPKLGAFASFSGFGKSTSAATTLSAANSSPFSFLSKISSVTSVASTSSFTTSVASSSSVSKDTTDTSVAATKNGDSNDEYHSKLKGLNLAVLEWIKSHLDKNPLVILSPIFKDYEKHLEEIQKSKNSTSEKTQTVNTFKFTPTESKPESGETKSTATSIGSPSKSQTSPFSSVKFGSGVSDKAEPPKSTFSFGTKSPDEAPKSTFSFGTKAAEDTSKSTFTFGAKAPESTSKSFSFGTKPAESTGFSFGVKSSEEPKSTFSFGAKSTAEEPKSTFSFGSANSENKDAAVKTGFSFGSTSASASSTGFSFSGAKPFSFGNVAPSTSSTSEANKEEEEENDEPPKVEFTQVEEKDSVFSKKCKVFVKNDDKFGDRGVGTLHLKPVEGQKKTQLIVRADTNLGNLLLNMLLNESVPTKRMGKKDVLLVAVPMPTDTKPTQILIRVKTEEEADNLLEILEKHKKSE